MMTLKTLALLLALPVSAWCQQPQNPSPCESLVVTDADSLTGAYTQTSKEDIIIQHQDKDVLNVVFLVIDRTVILSWKVLGDVYCVDETSMITLTFRDGLQLKMPHQGKFNCDGELSVFFFGAFGNKKEYGALLDQEIAGVKITLRKSTVNKNQRNEIEAMLPADKSKRIQETAGCLVE